MNGCQRLLGWADAEGLLNKYEFFLGGSNENVWKLDCGDGSINLWIYLKLLNYTLLKGEFNNIYLTIISK